MTDKETHSKKNDLCKPPMIVTAQANLHGEAAVRVAVVVPWSEKPPKRIQIRRKDGVQAIFFDQLISVSDWGGIVSAIETARAIVALHDAVTGDKHAAKILEESINTGRRMKRQATPRVADAQQKHEEPRGSTPEPRSGARKRRVDAGGES